MPVIYADVVWLVNFVMDTVLLATASWIAKRPLRWSRVLLGGLIGSLYSLLLFLPSLSALTTWPGKALVSLLMVSVAIPRRNWLDLARLCALYYFAAIVFAGAALAMHFAVPGVSVTKGIILSAHRYAFVTSAKCLALLVAIPIAFALTQFTLRHIKRIQLRHASLYKVYVDIGGKYVEFVGLMDTGNQLRDPVSRRPVCMVEAGAIAEILPKALRVAIDQDQDLIAALQDVHEEGFAGRLSLVPFRGAGGQQQITVAVRPDVMEIEHEGVRRPVATPCVLAILRQQLSVEGNFQAILHTEVIAGDDELENSVLVKRTEHEAANSTTTPMD